MTGAEYKAGDATPCLGLSMDFEFCLSVVGLVLCLCLCFMFCFFFNCEHSIELDIFH